MIERLPVGGCPDCTGAPPSKLLPKLLRVVVPASAQLAARTLAYEVAWANQRGLMGRALLLRLQRVLVDGQSPFRDITVRECVTLLSTMRAVCDGCTSCHGSGWTVGVEPCAICHGRGIGVDAEGERIWKERYGEAPWFQPLNDLDLSDPEVQDIEVIPADPDDPEDEPAHLLGDVALHTWAALAVPGGCPACKGSGWAKPPPEWINMMGTPIQAVGNGPLPFARREELHVGGETWTRYAGNIVGVQSAQLAGLYWRLGDLPPMEVVAGLLVKGDRWLALKRLPSPVPEWSETWCLPGGKVEPEEHPEDALRREWREECDLFVEPTRMLWRADVTPKSWTRQVYVTVYRVEADAPIEPRLNPEAGTELRWVANRELPPEACLPSLQRFNPGDYLT